MKCTCCKKRANELLMVKCSDCQVSFCLTCRHREVHACPVEVKKGVNLPRVIAPKIEKI